MTTRAIQIELLLDGVFNPTTGEHVGAGTAYFYEAGTTNAKNVWTEKEKTNPYTSYTLNGVGGAQLYGEGNYKIVIKDSSGATVQTLDNIRLEFPYYGIRSVSSATVTMLSQDDFLLCDTTSNAITINALAAASWTRPLKIQRIAGSNNITFDPNGAETVDGSATLVISSDAIVEIISDGSNLRSVGFRSSFADTDNDTKIQVEESADEDTIRFDVGGSELMTIDGVFGISIKDNLKFTLDNPLIGKSNNNGNISISGGATVSQGGSMVLYGDFDSPSDTVKLITNNTDRLVIDTSGNASGSIILDEDNMVSNSDTKLATQQSIKAYVDSGTATMTNKTLTSPVLNTAVSGTAVLDEDTMSSNSATQVATQQSIKAYVDNNHPIKGDGTAGRVLRRSYVTIKDGTNASTIKMELVSHWNGDTIASTDNISGGDVGSFNYGGSTLCKILASGLTGNNIAVVAANLMLNSTGTAVTASVYNVGNDIGILIRNATSGADVTLHTLVDSGDVYIEITYLTSA